MLEFDILIFLNTIIFLYIFWYTKKRNLLGIFLISIVMFLYQMWGVFLYITIPEISYTFDIGNIKTNYINSIWVLKIFIVSNLIFFICFFISYKRKKEKKKKSLDYFVVNHTMVTKFFFIISSLGLISIYLTLIIKGGTYARIEGTTQTVPFAGLLSLMSQWVILYPMVRLYIFRKLDFYIIFFILLAFFGGILSGTSTAILVILLPFLILYFHSNGPISSKLFLLFGFTGYIILSVLRFARFAVAQYLHGGSINFINFIISSGNSNLDSMKLSVQGSIDGFSPMLSIITHYSGIQQAYHLYGQSYLASFVQLIPGILAPWKSNFLSNSRPDFVLGHYLATLAHNYNSTTLLPSGFVGEAYLNFGIFGVIIISAVLGVFMAKNEKLFHKAKYRIIPPPFLAIFVVTSFILMCRMYFSVFIMSIVSFSIPFIILYILPKKVRH